MPRLPVSLLSKVEEELQYYQISVREYLLSSMDSLLSWFWREQVNDSMTKSETPTEKGYREAFKEEAELSNAFPAPAVTAAQEGRLHFYQCDGENQKNYADVMILFFLGSVYSTLATG